MTGARKHKPRPGEDLPVSPADPSDWVKPVELIELLARRSAKREQAKAPTSPFYDAEFVASHRQRRKKKRRAD